MAGRHSEFDPARSERTIADLTARRAAARTDRARLLEDIRALRESETVEHPEVVQHYRDARATRVATDEGAVDTERQRQAVTSYRALIEALLHGESRQTTTSTTTEERTR